MELSYDLCFNETLKGAVFKKTGLFFLKFRIPNLNSFGYLKI